MFKRTYKGNIPLLAGLEFTSYFGITSFWILFFIQNGLSLLQIGLLESIFHGTSLLCEIPSGMLADRFSYKTNLYLARLASIVSSILTDNGATVVESKSWEKRRLAYEIQDFREGLYHIVNVEANDDAALKEFDRLSKINADILRHMIVKLDA